MNFCFLEPFFIVRHNWPIWFQYQKMWSAKSNSPPLHASFQWTVNTLTNDVITLCFRSDNFICNVAVYFMKNKWQYDGSSSGTSQWTDHTLTNDVFNLCFRPDDPISYLAAYLIKNKSQYDASSSGTSQWTDHTITNDFLNLLFLLNNCILLLHHWSYFILHQDKVYLFHEWRHFYSGNYLGVKLYSEEL